MSPNEYPLGQSVGKHVYNCDLSSVPDQAWILKVIGLFGSGTETSCDQRTKSRCIAWFYNPNVDVQIHVLTHQIIRLLSYSTYRSVPDICIDLIPFSWSLLPVPGREKMHEPCTFYQKDIKEQDMMTLQHYRNPLQWQWCHHVLCALVCVHIPTNFTTVREPALLSDSYLPYLLQLIFPRFVFLWVELNFVRPPWSGPFAVAATAWEDVNSAYNHSLFPVLNTAEWKPLNVLQETYTK